MVDARLRPHGRNAPHATPLSQYLAYLDGEAAVWELQSLTRLRHIWGNREICRAIHNRLRDRVQKIPVTELKAEIVSMRGRLETAVAEDLSPGEIEIKRSAGGLLDIEFALQYLALSHKELRVPANYFEALSASNVHQHLGAGAFDLAALYADLREFETQLRLIMDAGSSTLPTDPEPLNALTRLTGAATPEALHKQILALRQQVRSIYDQIISAA
jgi:glutamate-ammonia-ligase adenylyltransferase